MTISKINIDFLLNYGQKNEYKKKIYNNKNSDERINFSKAFYIRIENLKFNKGFFNKLLINKFKAIINIFQKI